MMPNSNPNLVIADQTRNASIEFGKAARNSLSNALDAHKRSQIMFMDRDDILILCVVANLSLPEGAFATNDNQSVVNERRARFEL